MYKGKRMSLWSHLHNPADKYTIWKELEADMLKSNKEIDDKVIEETMGEFFTFLGFDKNRVIEEENREIEKEKIRIEEEKRQKDIIDKAMQKKGQQECENIYENGKNIIQKYLKQCNEQKQKYYVGLLEDKDGNSIKKYQMEDGNFVYIYEDGVIVSTNEIEHPEEGLWACKENCIDGKIISKTNYLEKIGYSLGYNGEEIANFEIGKNNTIEDIQKNSAVYTIEGNGWDENDKRISITNSEEAIDSNIILSGINSVDENSQKLVQNYIEKKKMQKDIVDKIMQKKGQQECENMYKNGNDIIQKYLEQCIEQRKVISLEDKYGKPIDEYQVEDGNFVYIYDNGVIVSTNEIEHPEEGFWACRQNCTDGKIISKGNYLEEIGYNLVYNGEKIADFEISKNSAIEDIKESSVVYTMRGKVWDENNEDIYISNSEDAIDSNIISSGMNSLDEISQKLIQNRIEKEKRISEQKLNQKQELEFAIRKSMENKGQQISEKIYVDAKSKIAKCLSLCSEENCIRSKQIEGSDNFEKLSQYKLDNGMFVYIKETMSDKCVTISEIELEDPNNFKNIALKKENGSIIQENSSGGIECFNFYDGMLTNNLRINTNNKLEDINKNGCYSLEGEVSTDVDWWDIRNCDDAIKAGIISDKIDSFDKITKQWNQNHENYLKEKQKRYESNNNEEIKTEEEKNSEQSKIIDFEKYAKQKKERNSTEEAVQDIETNNKDDEKYYERDLSQTQEYVNSGFTISQKLAMFLSNKEFLMKIPFIKKYVNRTIKALISPESVPKESLIGKSRKEFEDWLSKNGKLKNLDNRTEQKIIDEFLKEEKSPENSTER